MSDLETRLHDEVGREVAGYAPSPDLADRIRRRTRHRILRRRAVAVGAVVVVIAVGVTITSSLGHTSRQSQRVTTNPTVTTATAPVEYEADVTVLANAEHGPQLCISVATSLPPQCGGPTISNWDWSKVTGQQTVNSVTWGEYHVVGTYDGTTFTLTRPATAPPPRTAPTTVPATDIYAPPCPTPAGGWPVVKTTLTQFQAFQNMVGLPTDFGGMWTDVQGRSVNDPGRDVYTVTYTGDVAQHRAAIAAVWPGPVCVVQVAHSQAELNQIVSDLTVGSVGKDLGLQLLSAGLDPVHNRVVATAYVATPALQAAVDQRFGPGTVHLEGALQPVR